MQVKLTKRDVIWSYIGTIMSMGANLLMLPVIIYYLDSDMLGLWYVFTSIGAIAVLFDLGFAVTFARNITYCWSGAQNLKKENVVFADKPEPDFFLMKKVLQACKAVYLRISGTALTLMLSIGMVYILYISRHIDSKEHVVAWLIYAFAVFLNLYYGYYASFLRGVGAVDQANKNTVIARGAQIITTVVLLVAGTGIIGVCVAYLIYGTLFRFLGKWKFYNYQHIGDELRKINESISQSDVNSLIGVVWHNAWRDGMIAVANYLSNQATIIICSLYLSLTETGIYSIGVQIAMAIAAISGTLYMASQPQLQASYISKNIERTKNTMSVIVLSLIVLYLICLIVFITMILPILRIIKPEAIISIPVLLSLCCYHLLLKFRDCYTSYFSCTNRIPYLRSFIVSAVLCVLLSALFTGYMHWRVWGLIIAQMVSQLVYNVWHWPILAHQEMQMTASELIKRGKVEFVVVLNRFIKKNK